MDKVFVFGTKDCRFESCQGHVLENVMLEQLVCAPAGGHLAA